MSDTFDHELDAFESLDWDYEDDYRGRFSQRKFRNHLTYRTFRTCKYCGTVNLRWTQVNNVWRLSDGKTIHECWKNDKKT